MSHYRSDDIKAIEQKAEQQHREAEKARKAVQEILLQKLATQNRSSSRDKNK